MHAPTRWGRPNTVWSPEQHDFHEEMHMRRERGPSLRIQHWINRCTELIPVHKQWPMVRPIHASRARADDDDHRSSHNNSSSSSFSYSSLFWGLVWYHWGLNELVVWDPLWWPLHAYACILHVCVCVCVCEGETRGGQWDRICGPLVHSAASVLHW